MQTYDRVSRRTSNDDCASGRCSDVKKISWSGDQSNWLLAGTAAGLIGWNVEADKVLEQGRMYKPKLVDFLLPESEKVGTN